MLAAFTGSEMPAACRGSKMPAACRGSKMPAAFHVLVRVFVGLGVGLVVGLLIGLVAGLVAGLVGALRLVPVSRLPATPSVLGPRVLLGLCAVRGLRAPTGLIVVPPLW